MNISMVTTGKDKIDDFPSGEIAITVPLRLTSSPRYSRGNLHMKYEMAEVTQDGKPIGSIAPCVGGGIELHDEASGESWFMNIADLWEAFQKSLPKEVTE